MPVKIEHDSTKSPWWLKLAEIGAGIVGGIAAVLAFLKEIRKNLVLIANYLGKQRGEPLPNEKSNGACCDTARVLKERNGAEACTGHAERQIPAAVQGAAAVVSNGKREHDDENVCDGKTTRAHFLSDELKECNTIAQHKKRQILPTKPTVDALERYTEIASYAIHSRNVPGVLSMDIHPSKEIVATGGIDTNVVLFDRLTSQIRCTLSGHSKKVTDLKFVPYDELIVTGSADKTVSLWKENEEGSYNCIHTLRNHTAKVEAVTVQDANKYLVSASKDNTWCLYDISTASCIVQVGEVSGKQGYTAASFHPDGRRLCTGSTEALVKIWDTKTQSTIGKFEGHAGPVGAVSFSENGHFLATAALDGVKLWDLRKMKRFRSFSPYDSETPTNYVEFDSSGSYLAVAGADTRVYQVANSKHGWSLIKTLPDLSGTGKVMCAKFGPQAKYIAVVSMGCKVRFFGIEDALNTGQWPAD